MKSFRHSLLLICFMIGILGCEKSSDSNSNNIPLAFELSDVSSDGCLSLEKLSALIQRPGYSFPASMMTTDFRVLSEAPLTKVSYLTYSSFFYKTMPINQMGILPLVTQIKCEKILIPTSSKEILTYQITNSSETSLQFRWTEEFADSVPDYKREALKDRPLVTEYTIDFLPNNSLKITLKAKTIDPICNNKNLVTTETTKYISWARSSSDLPLKYEINPNYLSAVRSLVAQSPAPIPGPEPIPEVPLLSEGLGVTEIRALASMPLNEEWKTCR